MTYALEDIGQSLKAARERRGLSQRALADAAGTDQARISKIENGDIDLRLSSLIDLARTLGLEVILAERHHLPAIKAMTREKAMDADPKRKAEFLRNIEGNLERFLVEQPDNFLLKRAKNVLPGLSVVGLTETDLSLLKQARTALSNATPGSLDALTPILRALIRLRNEKAHGVLESESAPRPAYSLDDDDE